MAMRSEQLRRFLVSVASILCTVGSAVLALALAKRDVSKLVTLPTSAYRTMLVVGIAFIVIGAIAFLISFLIPLTANLIGRVFEDHRRHVCVYATSADVYLLHDLYTEYFQGEVASPSLMRDWIKRSPKALAMIFRVDHRSPRKQEQVLVGSFKVLMLNDGGLQGIEAGELSGSTLGPEHIVRSSKDAKGYYVGDVVATTWRARAAVLANLNVACERALKDGKPIYARPLTPDGKRVMIKHGFVQVTDGKAPQLGKMCVLLAVKAGDPHQEEGKARQRKTNSLSSAIPKRARSRQRPALSP